MSIAFEKFPQKKKKKKFAFEIQLLDNGLVIARSN